MIDLHCHSCFSDGTLTPAELAREAERAGLVALALTDHDTLAGLPEFLEAAKGMRLRAIAGVEISADFEPGTMHILGYFVRPDDPALNEKLAQLREGRDERNRRIVEKLNDLGCPITLDQVLAAAGGGVPGRPHIARAMIEAGCVAGKDEAFAKFLAKGRPAYVGRFRFGPEDSILAIRAAGGVPVLAHPVSLELKGRELRDLVKRLKDAGLGGIEVYYPEHPPSKQAAFHRLAKDFGLVSTGGSDFHGPSKGGLKLGRGFGRLRVPDVVLEKLEAERDPLPLWSRTIQPCGGGADRP